MTQLDYLLIFLFSILVVVAGISFSKTGRNMKSFFAGGGGIPSWISGLSLFMSFFSAGTFVVWGSIAYESGMVSITIQSTMAISGFLIFLFIARRWKRTGALTVAEYISQRFGKKVQKMYTYLFIFISLFTAGAFLYPVARIVNVSTGFPIESVILFLGISILLYTAIGGFWAVLTTDVLQFIILTVGVLIVIPLSFGEVNGIRGFISDVPGDFFTFTNQEYTPWFMFAFLIYNLFFIGGNWAYVQRYTSVKDERSAGRVGLIFGLLYLLFPLFWMLPPMIYRALNPSLDSLQEVEGAYLLMCKQVLPSGMLGLMLAGMVFATASSVNTTLNMMAAVTTNDLFKVFSPKSSQKVLIRVARISTILFGAGAIVVALLVPRFGGIVNVVLSVAAITGVPLYAPPIWGLFSKRITGKAIVTITVLSLSITAFFKFLAPVLLDISLSRANEMALGALVPLGMLSLFELYAGMKRLDIKDYKKYVETSNKEKELASRETSTAREDNIFGIRVISVAAAVTGTMILVLGILSEKGAGYILTAGTVVLIFSLFIFFGTKKKKLKKELFGT
ncbi:MAG: Na+:solute symporter [Bacteroidales bacterium]|nr:Na+:solute symporter [Bacteroidales bacterium]MDT8430717.1 sodium:solute symporter family protein [Bacteroidales bacterium]